MKQFIICLFTIISLSACKSSKRKAQNTKREPKIIISAPITTKTESSITPNKSVIKSYPAIAEDIVDYAKQFQGVKYKYGGTTKKGMDCSGLIYNAFRAHDISIPRVSRDMAQTGIKISIDNVKAGDLLFFKTNPKRNAINHVGLIVTALPGNIEFIHSTSSLGVIISSLAERYWYYSFFEARRLL